MTIILLSCFLFRGVQADTCLVWAKPASQSKEQVKPLTDQLSRDKTSSPVLLPAELFRWGLINQGLRRYGLYGRVLPSTSKKLPSTLLMYRGHVELEFSWVSRHFVSQASSLSAVTPPESLEDLKQLALRIVRREKVTADPLDGASGGHYEEHRVYEATPPYHLLSLSIDDQRPQVSQKARYQNGVWEAWVTKNGSTQHKRLEIGSSKETLISRRFPIHHLHVGGHYHVWELGLDGEHKVGVKVIDRRFERERGLWVERVEIEKGPLDSQKRERLIVSPSGSLISSRRMDQLILVKRSKQHILSREHLSLKELPLDLRGLQGRSGQVKDRVISAALLPLSKKLQRCRQLNMNTHPQSGRLLLRLGLGSSGRLLAASATSSSHWPMTRCVLRTLGEADFPKPTAQQPTEIPSRVVATIAHLLFLSPQSIVPSEQKE